MGITIKDVRAKYPQYADLTNQELADALHQKFYADKMEAADFYKRIGFDPAKEPAAPAMPTGEDPGALTAPAAPARTNLPGTSTAPALPGVPDPLVAALTPPPPAPRISTAPLPPAPGPRPAALDTTMGAPGMMGGASPDQRQWAVREIARKEAAAKLDPLTAALMPDAGPGLAPPPPAATLPPAAPQRAADFPPSRGEPSLMDQAVGAARANQPAPAAARPGSSFTPTQTPYDPLLQALSTELGNTPERLTRGFAGNTLAQAELSIAENLRNIGTIKDLPGELAAVQDQIAQRRADLAASTGVDRPTLQSEVAALEQRAQLLERAIANPELAQEALARTRGYVEASQRSRVGAQATIDTAEAGMKPSNPRPGLQQAIVSGVASFGDMAPGLAGTLVTRNPLVGMAYMTGYSRGSTYADKRGEGVESGKAATAANLYAVAEAIPEYLPLAKVLEEGVGPFAKVVGVSLAEGASEVLTSGLQTLIDMGVLNESMTWGEAIQAAEEAGAAGMVMGAISGGAGAVTDGVRDRVAARRAAKGTPADPNANPPITPPARPVPPPADPLVAALTPPAPPEAPPVPAAPPPAPLVQAPVEAPAGGAARPATGGAVPEQYAENAKNSGQDATGETITEAEALANPDRYEILDADEGEGTEAVGKVALDTETGRVLRISPPEAAGSDAGGSQPQATRAPGEDVGSGPGAPPAAGADTGKVSDLRNSDSLPTSEPAPTGRRANQPDNIEFIDAAGVQSIGTEPGVMQYKAGGDEQGVTDRLKGITEWRPERAGMSIIYEYADGRRVIADGHQRLGLAKRLAGEGKRIQMPAMILRERDGVSPQEARVTAALKNISEGSGTAVDAAKVLRDTDKSPDQLGLPPSSALVRDAMGMRNLSPDAFGMVVNGVATEQHGGIVGRLVQDQGAQANILALLNRLKPANQFQAESIVRQAAADTVTETQDSLFGPEADTQNLYLERAKVLDGAIKRVRDDMKTFRTLVERAETVQGAGNVLNADENQRRLASDAAVSDYLSKEANTKGAISEALTAAARALKGGRKPGQAVDDFLATVQRELGSRGGERAGGDQGRPAPQPERSPEPQPPVAAPPEAPPQDDLLAAMMPAPQTGKSPDQVRAEAEAKVKADQSKMRKPGGNSGDAGPLFGGDQGDLLAPKPEPDRSQTGADTAKRIIEAGIEIVDLYTRDADPADIKPSTDLMGSPEHAQLAARLSKVTGFEARAKVADEWVKEKGRKAGIEFLVIMDKDGVPFAMASGFKTGDGGYSVSFTNAAMRALKAGLGAYATHNHPSGSALSATDFVAFGFGVQRIVAVASDGSARHEASVIEGQAFGSPGIGADARNAQAMKDVDGVYAFSIGQENFNRHGDTDRAKAVYRAAFNLALHRVGVIRYSGDALDVLRKEGLSLEDVDRHLDRVSELLGRAGFAVAKERVAVGDRPGGEDAGADGAGPQGQGGSAGVPAAEQGQGDRSGRVPAAVKPPADDFDTAAKDVLNDIFGTEGEAEQQQSVPWADAKAGDRLSDGSYMAKRRIRLRWQAEMLAAALDGTMMLDGSTGFAVVTETPLSQEEVESAFAMVKQAEGPGANAKTPSGETITSVKVPKDFGKPAKPAKRSDADIGKDLGGLFNEPGPPEFLSPMERAKAKAKKRPTAQGDLFDQLNAAQPGQRQMDLEDLIAEQKARGNDLFGLGEDVLSLETYARAVPLFREALDGKDFANLPVADTIRAVALRFRAQGLTRQGIERMLPYLKQFLEDVKSGKLSATQETQDVPGPGGDLERDRGDANAGDGVGTADVPPARGGSATGAGTRGGATGRGNGQRQGGSGVPDGDAAPVGERGDQGVQRGDGAAGQSSADRDGAGGGDRGQPRLRPDDGTTADTRESAVDAPGGLKGAARAEVQAKADKIKPKPGDEANIRATLPLLLPEQQDDVLKVETRFAKPDGHGMLLTNGTGTGKTYSGGGVIKRFVQAGKDNILVVAPSQGILDHWLEALTDLGVPSTRLDDASSAGKGVVLTTYANLGMNNALATREWDLVVTDEAHKLSTNKTGDATAALRAMRAITHRPSDLLQKSDMLHADEWEALRKMKDGDRKTAEAHRLFELRRKEAEAFAKRPRGKVLFLSATPFAYDVNTDYAEGYLFDYPKDGHVGNSRQGGRNLFMVENFGYRIRYHKLTKPEAAVDRGVFERMFHEKLRREGALSGRALDVAADYDRKFVKISSGVGETIDAVLKVISEGSRSPDKALADGYQKIQRHVNRSFDYLKRMQLLEAIKAEAAIPDIEKHLAMGRKVVVFHDFNVGGGTNPFADLDALDDANMLRALADLLAKAPEAETLKLDHLTPPVIALAKAFGKRARIYNGTEKLRDRAAAKEAFNTDGSGVDVIIVQSAAGEAGISLHDTTGGHQRVLINLGMPVRPTTALQEEGRTRRVGSVSDAIYRYYNTGTTWERQAFATKIAENSGTVENLALGNEARTIREAFIDAYMDSGDYPPSAEDGKGGKDKDRAAAKTSPYEQAKAHYFGRMKTSGRRDQREGIDFYPTPEPLAFKMVEWAGIRQYERVLEPSAGDGAIARYFPADADRTIVEPSLDLNSRAQLKAPGARALTETFENHHIVNKYDAIVMNPPFGMGGKTAFEHLEKAMKHIKPGGRIVALVPTGPSADKRWEAIGTGDFAVSTFILPPVTFERAGTSVRSRIIIMDKVPPGPNGRPDEALRREMESNSFYSDLSGLEKITDLFDRIEDMRAPARPARTTDPLDEATADPLPPLPGPALVAAGAAGFKTAETKHAKTGDDLYVATARDRVEKEAYSAMLAVAKRHGGWYSSFRGNGAIPGFQFKSEAQRQAFLDDMGKPTVGLEETAYHGTPHEFDRFSLDAIGTGEGAQAYGWGLYFAGKKDVADYYRRNLSRRLDAKLRGKRIEDQSGFLANGIKNIGNAMDGGAVSFEVERDAVVGDLRWRADREARVGSEDLAREATEAADILAAVSLKDISWRGGSLYTVEIPDADQMMDWSLSLSEQPASVKKALAKEFPNFLGSKTDASQLVDTPESPGNLRFLADQFGWRIVDHFGFFSVISPAGNSISENKRLQDAKNSAEAARKHMGDMDGRTAYLLLADRLGSDRAASEALRAAGIPGHRYLDGMSRAAQGGTHNYVIYDDAAVSITGLEESGPQFRTDTPAFKAWFGDSKVVDAEGKPLVVYHGSPTRGIQAFYGRELPGWFAADRDMAKTKYGVGGVVYAVNLSIQNPLRLPFDMNKDMSARQVYKAAGLDVAAYRGAPDQVDLAYEIVNNDDFAEAAKAAGYDGLEVDEGGVKTWAIFEPSQAKSVNNRGTFDPADPRISYQRETARYAAAAAEEIARQMPALRAELDRLDLKRVRLAQDTGAGWQGAFQVTGDGDMEILIGASLDPQATLHHEVIHALRAMNLFTPEEWKALTLAAPRWLKKHDIAKRYPEMTEAQQIEEAIAEEFSQALAKREAPAGSLLVQIFNKIARLLRGVRSVMNGAGFQTPEDIFGRVLSGQIGRRQGGQAAPGMAFQRAMIPSRQARAHMATAMGGRAAFIPDRRIWEELTRSGVGIWGRLRGGAAAAKDATDKARIVFQDRFLPVLRAQQAVERASGAPLPLDQNAYIAETTFSGKVGRHLFEIDEDYTKPIIDLVAGAKGTLTVEEVGTWLYARHAIERNAQIASINPAMPDGGSGMTDAEASLILAQAAAGPHAARLDQIGALVDQLRERTLKLREDAGLITNAEANLWRTQYRHYVPLKGFADTDHGEAVLDVAGIGRRFNTRGPETQRALGRQTEAFNPLQAAITQAQEVAVRAEKNRVGQALYEVAKAHPSKALWTVKTPKTKRYYNRTTGLVETRVEDPISLFMDPNEMAVKVSGVEHRITFHDPRLARAAGSVGADQMGAFLRIMSIAARWFSMARTMLNPEFMITNAFRDLQTAQINIRGAGGDDRNAIALAMMKNWRKAFVGSWRGQGNKADTEWTRHYREFEKAGAKVSFWTLEQPEAGAKDLERRVNLKTGRRAWRAVKHLSPSALFSIRDNPVVGFIERTNMAVDNAIRLAAFVEARKRGWAEADAAALAKNLTVNFNRRGEAGATMNALYPFFNAAVQGSTILLQAMKSRRVAKVAVFLVAAGVINDLVNAALSDEDDDGELAYDKVPDYRNQRNIHLMMWKGNDDPLAIPMPYGYNIFPYLGQQIGKVTRGVKSWDEAAADFAGAIFGAFSPIQGGDAAALVTPTVLDPVLEMSRNQDWLGLPIRPENPFDDLGPDAYKAYASASELSKWLAEKANTLTGGSIAESGAVDVSPEYIDHAFNFIVGSAGAFWSRSMDIVAKAATGNFDEIEQRDVPFVRTLTTATGDWLDRDRYYRFRTEVREAHKAAETYAAQKIKVPKDVAALARLYDDLLAAERELKGQGEWNPNKAGSTRQRDANAVRLAFNRKFLRVAGPQGE